MRNYNFYVYILTNPAKTVLYTGVTNDLSRRVAEHKENKGNPKTFAGKYYCYNLVYFEHFSHIQ
jgi:putative endonuclease